MITCCGIAFILGGFWIFVEAVGGYGLMRANKMNRISENKAARRK